jgi:hypothetical protein
VDIYSKLQILIEDKVTQTFFIAKGVVYSTEILKLVVSAGITNVRLSSSAAITSRALEYKIGTSKLDIINDLLAQMGFNSLDVDNLGFVVAEPYVSPQLREVTYEYLDGNYSILYQDATQNFNLFDVANTFVVVASNAETLPLKSIFVNNSLTDPTSVINRGRRIVHYEEIDDISDQNALDNYTRKLADEINNVYGEFVFNTSLNPMHESKEILRVVKDGASNIYEEVGWRITLSKNATMRHVGRWLGNA